MLLKKMGLPISGYFSATILYLCFSTSVFALSASTVNTIKGTMPALSIDGGKTIISDLNELLYMTLPDGTKFTPDMSTTIKVPLVPFNQLGTLLGIDSAAKPLPLSYFYDQDIDIPKTLSAVSGSYSAVLRKANGLVVTDLEATVEPCDGPYTLTISATESSVSSQYGDPISQTYPARKVIYTLTSDPKICSLKPTNLYWMVYKGESLPGNWSLATTGGVIDPIGGGGYTNDFMPGKGFVSNPTEATPAGAKFPTTGFANATFQMVMSGGQNKYTYSATANPASSVDINATTGVVTLVSKPTGTVALKATPIDGGTPLVYSFDIKLWATPQSTKQKWPEANTICTTTFGSRLLTRSEYTNSPSKNIVEPPAWKAPYNYSTRAIGTLNSEWGDLSQYTNSGWTNGYYWTNEMSSASAYYMITVKSGTVAKGSLSIFSTQFACLN